MNCLTINFPPHLEVNLQAQLSLTVINVMSVVQAVAVLEATDFACIIEDARQVDCANDDLAQLLAITPLSTRIIALVSARTVPDPDYWQAQGAILLYEENEEKLIRQLLECCSKSGSSGSK